MLNLEIRWLREKEVQSAHEQVNRTKCNQDQQGIAQDEFTCFPVEKKTVHEQEIIDIKNQHEGDGWNDKTHISFQCQRILPVARKEEGEPEENPPPGLMYDAG